ncbi:hypothetical protein TL16_g12456 [Triparma laevis f. inornata]|uniref:COX assembly mitochondrial protein n=2 Tax=Triparma laevis TaxID=1534972 RepID=A0A9W7DLN9_9STRA|nr:hypothetical protein TrLO_g5453 [Triparma laevis f. longispina]GMH92805.1 hypothetical protein TL16_g12456 [Triparma laevis f. inornata]
MHPPLKRPHPDCQSVIRALEICHSTKPYLKFLGACNDEKASIDICFRNEKQRVRKQNMDKARKKDMEFEKEWQEIKSELNVGKIP